MGEVIQLDRSLLFMANKFVAGINKTAAAVVDHWTTYQLDPITKREEASHSDGLNGYWAVRVRGATVPDSSDFCPCQTHDRDLPIAFIDRQTGNIYRAVKPRTPCDYWGDACRGRMPSKVAYGNIGDEYGGLGLIRIDRDEVRFRHYRARPAMPVVKKAS